MLRSRILFQAGRRGICCALSVFALSGGAAWGQSAMAPKPVASATAESASAQVAATGGAAKPPPLSAKELREAQIAADTQKLYALAQELKVEMDKSTKDTLSLTVVRKAAEIEKLAHSLSERMKSN